MKKGDNVEISIESFSGNGKAVARRDGLIYFIEDAVPGDVVVAKIWKVKKNYVEARAIEIIKPSEHRITPKCKHFGICGGCKWQNLNYDSQLIFKQKHVLDTFIHIGNITHPNVQPVIGCPDIYFYRNKMEYTFSNYQWLATYQKLEKQNPEIALGLHVPERYNKVLNIEECFLQSELSYLILNTVRKICRELNLSVYSTKTHEGYLRHLVIRDSKRTKELMVNLVTTYDSEDTMRYISQQLLNEYPEITTFVNNITDRKSLVAFGEYEKVYYGSGYITEKLGEYLFHISSNSFFQTNTLQAEKLYSIVKELANLKKSDVVYDLYSGTGTIAIYLSKEVERVVGIEVVQSAIKDAEKNAKANSISNCFFILGDLKNRLLIDNSWLNNHPKPSVIIVDPPRSGVHPKVIESIIKLNPNKIVYVSCNPATQARDAKMLLQGGYDLKIVKPVDMFPHTDHIESVALFEL